MSPSLPDAASMADEDLLRELVWRQRAGGAAGERWRELSGEHARRIREAADRTTRDRLVTPLACGLADASRPTWVP